VKPRQLLVQRIDYSVIHIIFVGEVLIFILVQSSCRQIVERFYIRAINGVTEFQWVIAIM